MVIDENKVIESKNDTNSKSNVIESIIEDMKELDDFRLLIFSEHDNSFNNIYEFLDNSGILYGKLVGNSDHVQCVLDDYKNGRIKILILNAKHYGSGINLEMTTHIIFYHRMNEELEKQVIGRGYRFGRKQDLNILYLLHENEP